MSSAWLLTLIYLAFISLGLPDGVVGVAWPAMRVGLGQPLQAAGLITLVVTGCSALSGFASGWVLQRVSAGVVVTVSGWLTGLALLGFAVSPSFVLLLAAAIPLGFGAGAVDAAMNHFVARHYSSRHMNWLHGCWGVGATLGPVIMGLALAQTAGSAAADAGVLGSGWRLGYLAIGALQLLLATAFVFSLKLWALEPDSPPAQLTQVDAQVKPAARPVALWLAPFLFFLYAAVEVGTSLWAATILIEQLNVSSAAASVWVSGYFAAIMAGRFAIGLVSARWGNRRLVRYGLMIALLGALLVSVGTSVVGLPTWLALAGLVLLGLGCAPIYPSLMHEAARRFDAATAQRVIGRQVGTAYVGCMVVPAALGLVGAHAGVGLIMPLIAAFVLALLACATWLDRMT
jgi:fucose permease